jgi:hypothetical protein
MGIHDVQSVVLPQTLNQMAIYCVEGSRHRRIQGSSVWLLTVRLGAGLEPAAAMPADGDLAPTEESMLWMDRGRLAARPTVIRHK